MQRIDGCSAEGCAYIFLGIEGLFFSVGVLSPSWALQCEDAVELITTNGCRRFSSPVLMDVEVNLFEGLLVPRLVIDELV